MAISCAVSRSRATQPRYYDTAPVLRESTCSRGSGHYSTTTSTSPAPTVPSTTTATRATRPVLGDFSSFCIFIASITTTPCCSTTSSPTLTRTRTTRPGIGAFTARGPAAASPAPRRPRSDRGSSTANSNLRPSIMTPSPSSRQRYCRPSTTSEITPGSIRRASTSTGLPSTEHLSKPLEASAGNSTLSLLPSNSSHTVTPADPPCAPPQPTCSPETYSPRQLRSASRPKQTAQQP